MPVPGIRETLEERARNASRELSTMVQEELAMPSPARLDRTGHALNRSAFKRVQSNAGITGGPAVLLADRTCQIGGVLSRLFGCATLLFV
jgi:hypothetical protein